VTLVATACSGHSGSARSAGSTAATASFEACLLTEPPDAERPSLDASSEQGLQDAAATDPALGTDVVQVDTAADAAGALDAFAARRCGLIVTVGAGMVDATEAAAAAHPAQHFAIVDGGFTPPLPKVAALLFNTAQAAFLAGYLAAGVSKSGIVATFGGQKLSTVTIDMDGFVEGVEDYDERHGADVKALGWDERSQTGSFTGDFVDQAAAAKVARTLMARGADVLFPVAGGADLGAAAAVAGAGTRMIWEDTDGCVTAPQYCGIVLSSTERQVAAAVERVVLASAHGGFTGGNEVGTLVNGDVALAPFHQLDAQVPAALKSELTQVRQDIIDGSITITSPSQPGG